MWSLSGQSIIAFAVVNVSIANTIAGPLVKNRSLRGSAV